MPVREFFNILYMLNLVKLCILIIPEFLLAAGAKLRNFDLKCQKKKLIKQKVELPY